MMNDLPEYVKQLSVSSFGQLTGKLTQPAHFEFSYFGAQPVSLTMQLRAAPYKHGTLHPVFAQNLPEGYVRRYICEKLERVAKVNDLYLLALQHDKGIGHLGFE